MNRNKELAKNTVVIALGKICTKFVTFLLLPIYTHYLSTAEYGTIDMIITCTSLVAPILSLQMERAVFRYLIDARSKKEEQKKILSTAFASVIPSIIIIAIAIPMAGLAFHLEHAALIGLIVITAILSNVALQIPRGLGKNLHFSVGSAIVGILNASISIIAVIFLHMGVAGILLSNIIAHLAGVAYITFSMRLYRDIKITKRDRGTLKELLRFSIPMIPNDISYWVISISDRVLIYLFLGNSFNGVYAVSTKFPALMVTIYNVFNMSWMETVSAHVNDSDSKDYLSKTYNTIVRLFATVCILSTAAMPFVFDKVIGVNFAESYKYIAVLMFGAFYNITVGMLGSIYIGYKKTKEMAHTTMLAAAINIVVNAILIKAIGIWAAAYSTLAAYAIVTFLRLISIRRTVKIKPDWKTFILINGVFIVNIILYALENPLVSIINLLASIIAAIIFCRDIFSKVVKMSTKRHSRAKE